MLLLLFMKKYSLFKLLRDQSQLFQKLQTLFGEFMWGKWEDMAVEEVVFHLGDPIGKQQSLTGANNLQTVEAAEAWWLPTCSGNHLNDQKPRWSRESSGLSEHGVMQEIGQEKSKSSPGSSFACERRCQTRKQVAVELFFLALIPDSIFSPLGHRIFFIASPSHSPSFTNQKPALEKHPTLSL